MPQDNWSFLTQLLLQQWTGALYAVKLVSFALVPAIIIELLAPARRLHVRTVLMNLAYAPVYMTLAGIALYPIDHFLSPLLTRNLLGWTVTNQPWWVVGFVTFVYLAVFDFFYYWFHRAQHRWPLLWRYHRFHHADPNISASSTIRHHWLEEVLRYFVLGIPVIVLFGQPDRTLPWLGMLIGIYGMFIHWNVKLPLGPLSLVIVGPQYHRIHHSLKKEHFDKNFAVFFPFWDRLFSTTCLPHKGEYAETGVQDGGSANGLGQLLPYPLISTATVSGDMIVDGSSAAHGNQR